MGNYVDNMYNHLKKCGYGDKYEHAGIYCICVDDKLVYIGKSHNMLTRVAQHYVGIQTNSERKYRILSEAQRKGHNINFDVLYYAKSQNYYAITEEIGAKEGEYIRKHKPALNTQIPRADNWRKYDYRHIDTKVILDYILNNKAGNG